MNVSVSLCTYNRSESLRRTLETFRAVDVPPGLSWELLLVDNNSTDDTKAVCEIFSDLPIRYLFEAKQGKSHALNRSVAEARGGLILFTDDDVDVSRDWLKAYWDAAQRNPDADFFGGRVIAVWEGTPPRWLVENQSWLYPVVQLDRGPIEKFLAEDEHPYFVGANMACRKAIFSDELSFSSHIGPSGSDALFSGNVRGEEMELQSRFVHAGFKGLYVPQAAVDHRYAARRMNESYLRRWYHGHGVAECRSGAIPQIRLFLGAPVHFWKILFLKILKYAALRYVGPSRAWLRAETEFAFASGVICESRKRHASKKA